MDNHGWDGVLTIHGAPDGARVLRGPDRLPSGRPIWERQTDHCFGSAHRRTHGWLPTSASRSITVRTSAIASARLGSGASNAGAVEYTGGRRATCPARARGDMPSPEPGQRRHALPRAGPEEACLVQSLAWGESQKKTLFSKGKTAKPVAFFQKNKNNSLGGLL